ncbi:hypothetical protein L1F30_14530 [Simiduia sp. 21SJ11W-1]|uniref:ATP-grasp fold amidoligase family protein n=1 Tax=Simiduia sp. 21SJ11W-1 TaxID=2909669 RepID=UPI0020A1F55D|nr:ATP-grasp fold amidoligase family protein [Simiduia sp. 21SJ11W-1]UTA47366.1 hypothetical protein L1F30_14530 [Simiduia sp. 21SJ11W-1]
MIKNIKNLLRKHEDIELTAKSIYFFCHKVIEKVIPDKTFLRIQYLFRTGSSLNLKNPRLYNEKIQWLKLNYRNPLLNKCVDKWEVREYIKSKGLENILIPAQGPYHSIEEIHKESLPEKFILKLTNGSSFNIICQNKDNFSWDKATRKFDKWKKINFFSARREWAYKDVENRIMIEELLESETGGLPSDIRFFCFNGEPEVIAVDLDSVENGIKTSNYFRHLYTKDWTPIDARIQYPKKPNHEVEKPANLDEMLETARKLSSDFPAVRVDLYNTRTSILFGELTFYHASGYQRITPEKFHKELGDKITLENLQ